MRLYWTYREREASWFSLKSHPNKTRVAFAFQGYESSIQDYESSGFSEGGLPHSP